MLRAGAASGLGGLLATASLSSFAFAAGFQKPEDLTIEGSQARQSVAAERFDPAVAFQLQQTDAPGFVAAKPPDSTGCSFGSGSQAIGMHVKISNSIHKGQPVALDDIQKLFDVLGNEHGNTITRKFYAEYASAFASEEVRGIVVKHLNANGLHADLVSELAGSASAQKREETKASTPATPSPSFRAVDTQPVSIQGMVFRSNSTALRIHQSISTDIRRGSRVSQASIKALFSALSTEDVKGLGEAFFVGYAKKFGSAEAVTVMIDALIPVVDGQRILPRGDATAPLITRLRWLGNSFPVGTAITARRDFFQKERNNSNLDIRALGLMLCINANIKPSADYTPSEIVRASQQIGYMNRLRGDEVRLGIMLRDALARRHANMGIEGKVIDQIKMPLLRRAQTIERRNPGITEALLSVSEDAYVAFLAEHAQHIIQSRESLADKVLFGSGQELHAILHSSPEFHYGPARDIARGFRLIFDPVKHVVKGERSKASTVGEKGYFGLLQRLGSAAARNRDARVWINMHGNQDGVFFTRGDAESSTGGAVDMTPPVSTEFISPEEEATQVLAAGGLGDLWLVVDSCEGWSYSEKVNERLIENYLKQMPIEQVVRDRRIPGRVIGSQCQMLSVGNMVMWYDEDLPEEKQENVRITYSLLMFETMQYC